MKTDMELKQEVEEELKTEPGLDAAEIRVDVVDGVVTLSGFVKTHTEQWTAARAVKRLGAVTAVFEEIEVKPPENNEGTGADIWVKTEGDKLILCGRSTTWLARQEAEKRAWETPGVTGVENEISVTC